MKIIAVIGSARKGNTYKIVKLVEEKMKKLGEVDFEYLFLKDLKLDFCQSCHSCFLNGEETCPHYSVVSIIEKKLMEADGFILATPVYSLQLNALMKNFIDHFSYVFHRPRFYEKKALVIADTAGAGEKETAKYLYTVTKFWGVNKTTILTSKNLDLQLNINEKFETKAEKISEDFYMDIYSKSYYSPSLKYVFFFNLWRAINSLDKTQKSLDYSYWKEQGWLNMDFYRDQRLNPFKKFFGRSIYKFMKKAMAK